MVFTHRNCIRSFLLILLPLLVTPLLAIYEGSGFRFAQVEYDGRWDPRPRAYQRLVSLLELRTSVRAEAERVLVRLDDPGLFNYPFIYMAGGEDFEPLSEKERKNLRKYIKSGGTVLIDDVSGVANSMFDSRIRKELSIVIPEEPLRRLPGDHVIYKSFYLLNYASGRKIVDTGLEGITFTDEDRTAVIYSRNDLGGAWSEDELGKWEYECVPGGETQREMALRLGVNIVLYAMTGNYKLDQIHEPFIKRRQLF